jgi:hypothetical protein
VILLPVPSGEWTAGRATTAARLILEPSWPLTTCLLQAETGPAPLDEPLRLCSQNKCIVPLQSNKYLKPRPSWSGQAVSYRPFGAAVFCTLPWNLTQCQYSIPPVSQYLHHFLPPL